MFIFMLYVLGREEEEEGRLVHVHWHRLANFHKMFIYLDLFPYDSGRIILEF